jgi:hypothetical protein
MQEPRVVLNKLGDLEIEISAIPTLISLESLLSIFSGYSEVNHKGLEVNKNISFEFTK